MFVVFFSWLSPYSNSFVLQKFKFVIKIAPKYVLKNLWGLYRGNFGRLFCKTVFLKKIEKDSISLIIIRLSYNYSNLYNIYMTLKFTFSTPQSITFLDKSIGWPAFLYLGLYAHKVLGVKDGFIKGKQLGWLNKLRLLLVSLTIQRWLKVNSSDNNVEYSTSGIVYITRSNMNSDRIQEFGT